MSLFSYHCSFLVKYISQDDYFVLIFPQRFLTCMAISMKLTAQCSLLNNSNIKLNSLRSFKLYATQLAPGWNLYLILVATGQHNMSKDINEHACCLFSEISNFLSETETARLLELAESGRLENSEVFHNSMDTLLSQDSFEHWDLNRDDVINIDEVHILVMQRF